VHFFGITGVNHLVTGFFHFLQFVWLYNSSGIYLNL
jgi:hypothetical protein